MCQVVKSSRFQDGSEVNVKFTLYLSQFECMSLLALLRQHFGSELPFPLTHTHLISMRRLLDSIERSV